MKKRVLATLTVFSLVLTMMLSVVAASKPAQANAEDGWPLSITCDPGFPIIGPNVGETREENVGSLMDGNKVVKISVKNYSPKIVKIKKKKRYDKYGAYFEVKGLKKGYAHIKVTAKLKKAQYGKKKYVWNIKKYPVGHNDDE